MAALSRVHQRLRVGLPEGARFVEEVSTYQTPQGERWEEWIIGPVQGRAATHIGSSFSGTSRTESISSWKILEISERERRRIGQDLHDGLGQHLAGIELMSQVLEQELASKNKTAAMKVNEIGRYVPDAISQPVRWLGDFRRSRWNPKACCPR